MNDSTSSDKITKEIMNPDDRFKGFTLEEIRYQRALIALQADFCKTKIKKSILNLSKANPLSPTSAASSMPGKAGAIALKLVKGLNYMDYIVLGFSLFSGVKKIASLFKKKKK